MGDYKNDTLYLDFIALEVQIKRFWVVYFLLTFQKSYLLRIYFVQVCLERWIKEGKR